MQSLAVGLSRAEDGYRIVFRKSGKFQLAGKGKKKIRPYVPDSGGSAEAGSPPWALWGGY
jgi:hypothetical protein